jgi:hypothetical protein
MEPVDHGLKPLKLWPNIDLSSFELFLWGICHSNEKWTCDFSWELVISFLPEYLECSSFQVRNG